MSNRLFLLLVMSCLFSFSAHAISDYNENNLPFTLKEIRNIANDGDRGAQFLLGLIAVTGGLTTNELTTAHLLDGLSKQGYKSAKAIG